MSMLDIIAPVLVIVAAIAVVALAYLCASTLKDRSERKREEGLSNGCRNRHAKRR